MLAQWFSKCVTNRPAISVNSCSYGGFTDACFSSPFRDGHRFSIMRKHSIISPVRRLLGHGKPSAIAWLIVSIGINSIDRILRSRLFSHIGKKCLKAIFPFSAHGHASAAVSRIIAFILVKASALYSLPGFIFRCFGHAMRCAAFNKFSLVFICHFSRASIVILKTATRFRKPAFEITCKNRFNRTAIATAVPSRSSVNRIGATHYGEPGKSFTSKVCKFGHCLTSYATEDSKYLTMQAGVVS